jgi:hypothetical protein
MKIGICANDEKIFNDVRGHVLASFNGRDDLDVFSHAGLKKFSGIVIRVALSPLPSFTIKGDCNEYVHHVSLLVREKFFDEDMTHFMGMIRELIALQEKYFSQY